MAFCTNCGTESNSAFCPNCGNGNSLVDAQSNADNPALKIVSTTNTGLSGASPLGARKPINKFVFIAIPLVLVAAIALIFVLSAPKNPFPKALEACGISEDESYIYLGDEGKTLLMDGEGESSAGANSADVWCVLQELNVPESTVAQMEKTSSLMGVVSDSWDGISADWTYHPDNGFDVVLKFEK